MKGFWTSLFTTSPHLLVGLLRARRLLFWIGETGLSSSIFLSADLILFLDLCEECVHLSASFDRIIKEEAKLRRDSQSKSTAELAAEETLRALERLFDLPPSRR